MAPSVLDPPPSPSPIPPVAAKCTLTTLSSLPCLILPPERPWKLCSSPSHLTPCRPQVPPGPSGTHLPGWRAYRGKSSWNILQSPQSAGVLHRTFSGELMHSTLGLDEPEGIVGPDLAARLVDSHDQYCTCQTSFVLVNRRANPQGVETCFPTSVLISCTLQCDSPFGRDEACIPLLPPECRVFSPCCSALLFSGAGWSCWSRRIPG